MLRKDIFDWMAKINEFAREELAVLNEIYPNEIVYKDNSWFEIELVHEKLSPLTFQFSFPDDYPDSQPKIFLDAKWLDGHDISEITAKMYEIKEEQVLFSWIQFLKDEMSVYCEKKQKIEQEDDVQEFIVDQTLDCRILSTDAYTQKKSKFVGHVAIITSIQDVKDVLQTLLSDKKIANATHNIYAYRFMDGDVVNEFHDDDGETGASQGMLYIMQRAKVLGFIVIVTRWYGGIQLGPDRFKIIKNLTRLAIEKRHLL